MGEEYKRLSEGRLLYKKFKNVAAQPRQSSEWELNYLRNEESRNFVVSWG
jgi:hypothetical protein